MTRINKIDKCRNACACEKCGTKIAKGNPYVWWKFKFGVKHIRCTKTECAPRPSELTQSAYLGAIADLQQQTFESCDTESDFNSAIDEIISQLEELRDEQQEKFDNIPQQLQDCATGELLQERQSTLDDAVSALQSIDISVEEDLEGEEKDSRLSEIRQEISSALDNIS